MPYSKACFASTKPKGTAKVARFPATPNPDPRFFDFLGVAVFLGEDLVVFLGAAFFVAAFFVAGFFSFCALNTRIMALRAV
jgi:hypothetical protein